MKKLIMMVLIMRLIILTEAEQQGVSMHLSRQDPLPIKSQDPFQTLIGTILMDGTRASLVNAMSGVTRVRLS